MRFLVDEDVPVEVFRCLQQQGHEAQLVFDVLGPRTPDDRVWDHAIRTQAVVVTCNRDDFLKLAGTAPETGLIIVNRRRRRIGVAGEHQLRVTAASLQPNMSERFR